jgi:hypothetical protein
MAMDNHERGLKSYFSSFPLVFEVHERPWTEKITKAYNLRPLFNIFKRDVF